VRKWIPSFGALSSLCVSAISDNECFHVPSACQNKSKGKTQQQKPEKRRQQQRRLHQEGKSTCNSENEQQQQMSVIFMLLLPSPPHFCTLFFSHFVCDRAFFLHTHRLAIVSLVNNVIFSVKFHSIGQGRGYMAITPC